MSLRSFWLTAVCILIVVLAPRAHGSASPDARQPRRVLVLLDLSGSMEKASDGRVSRFVALSREVQRTLESLNQQQQAAGLRTPCFQVEVWGFYSKQLEAGPWSADRCEASSEARFVPMTGGGGRELSYEEALRERERLADVRRSAGLLETVRPSPRRDTPLMQALTFGQERLKPWSEQSPILVLVTDGQPDCFVAGEDRIRPDAPLQPELKARRSELVQRFTGRWDALQGAPSPEGGISNVVLVAPLSAEAFPGGSREDLGPNECLLEEGGSRCGAGGSLGALLWELGSCAYKDCTDEPPLPARVGVCAQMTWRCVNGRWQREQLEACAASPLYEKEERTCDGLDNDCDGQTDEAPCFPACRQEVAFADVAAVGRAGRWHCSGIFVHPSAVLTARHCLPAEAVLVGDAIERPEAILPVRSAEPYPSAEVDVALLVLEQPREVPLHPRRGARDNSPPGSVLSHVGFGSSNPSGQSGFGVKRELLLDAQGWGCTPERSLREGCDVRHELRLAGSPGRDTCSGDSGGALFEFIPASPLCIERSYCREPESFPRFGMVRRLVGSTSRSLAGAGARCGQGGIYTRMDVIEPWLEARLEELGSASAPAIRR
jgi:hypothetical protein